MLASAPASKATLNYPTRQAIDRNTGVRQVLETLHLAPKLTLAFWADISNAKSLRRAQRGRFREQYFMLDQHRCAVLLNSRLKDVSFETALGYDLGKWQTPASDPVSELEGNLQFKPGQGYTLKSVWAPQAGTRYDGLYTIEQYGTKLNSKTNTHRLELMLERVADQKSIEDIMGIPKPSQLDDWKLFEKLEGGQDTVDAGRSK
ncbi:hypothetical protein DL764_008820 [Monosporascus ibericus]|uniref:Uncharacterized protein n=1 Tax=Monosporascus ibericus TaxID=155417 RepID=A0A4Q4SYT2_9PEZI|nr:hypothetical protein DL764_008820 [Monosporascus ibericus]